IAPPCSPSLTVADAPPTALDVMVQAQVLQHLRTLQHDLSLALLFITHDLSVLVEVADRLAIMYAGKVVEQGGAEAVFHSPAHPYTKALAAAFPAIGDMRFRGRPSGLGGDPPDPQQIPKGCPFHPRCAEARCSRSRVSPAAGRRRRPARSWACSSRMPERSGTEESPSHDRGGGSGATGSRCRWCSKTPRPRSTPARPSTRSWPRHCGSTGYPAVRMRRLRSSS